MLLRVQLAFVAVLGTAIAARAQLTQDDRVAVLGSMIAIEGAARIPMPLGKNGVELSDDGAIDRQKLQKELGNNGRSISPGSVVTITAIDFGDRSIEFELDGGGTRKKGFLSNIQVGVGGSVQNQRKQEPEPKGSKVTLKFSQKIPIHMTAEELKDLLNPVLDFAKQSLSHGAIEGVAPEFQEAVKAKQVRIGMDSTTVLLALGQPDRRIRDKNALGVDQEDWIYVGRGRRQTFVTFEKDVVVSIREY